MKKREHNHKGSRAPGGRVKDFFTWLRGLWAPRYVPQKTRFGDLRFFKKDIF